MLPQTEAASARHTFQNSFMLDSIIVIVCCAVGLSWITFGHPPPPNLCNPKHPHWMSGASTFAVGVDTKQENKLFPPSKGYYRQNNT